MKYVTGTHALNIENSLNTCGDWHSTSIHWEDNYIVFKDTDDSIFGDWGIEYNKSIPFHEERFAVANDLRAVLDMMIDDRLKFLKGFRNDWFCTDEYNQEFFSQVIKLKSQPNWNGINTLMKKEFMWDWDSYVTSSST